MQVIVTVGSIMDQEVDVIVNPANERLLHGGGLCGIIYDAILRTGRNNYQKLMDDIEKIPTIDDNGTRCDYGDAKITGAYGLRFKYLIHTVGAIEGRHNEDEQRKLIGGCYRNSVELAIKNGCKSIAFPLISTGIFGVSKDLVAKTIIDTFKEMKEKHSDDDFLVKVVVLQGFYFKWDT
jgi:O-acetyl-ADP-ribose deacetylase